MIDDSTDHPKPPAPRKARRGSDGLARTAAAGPGAGPGDVDPATHRRPTRTTRRGCPRRRRSPPRRSPKARSRSAMPRSRTRCGSRRPPPASTACSMPRTTCSMSARPRTSASACPPMRGQRAAAGAHPAHDRGHRDRRDRLDHDRDRGAAAGSQPDQAAAAALQRAAARRQVVSLYPDHRRPLGAADPQASRRADPARALFRAVRLRRRGQPHHHGAAARVPDPLLHRRVLRKPHPAVPAVSDPPLLRARAPARSIFPAIPNWCARRTTSCPAAAMR